MDEAILRQLIAGGETATVEFKSSAARPIDIAVRMCGIANNRAGGIIIFGIEDATRAIVGIRNPSLTTDVVLRATRMIKPAVPLSETSVQTWTLDDAIILTVEIPPTAEPSINTTAPATSDVAPTLCHCQSRRSRPI